MSNLVVRPIRFTDRVDEMRRFLETLGLRRRLESESGGWVDMVAGGGGMLALHSAETSVRGAPSGFTALAFEIDDVDAFAQQVTAGGVRGVSVYDEAYGRAVRCDDPLGDTLVFDERADDLYGYREHAPEGVAEGLRVVAVRFEDPLGPYADFLQTIGLERRGEQNPFYVPYLAGGGDHGVVSLHHPSDGHPPFRSEQGAVGLSFETTEDLDEVAARLRAAGFEATLRGEPFGRVLETVDGDGLGIEVHEAPTP
jgi:hypothetical protein